METTSITRLRQLSLTRVAAIVFITFGTLGLAVGLFAYRKSIQKQQPQISQLPVPVTVSSSNRILIKIRDGANAKNVTEAALDSYKAKNQGIPTTTQPSAATEKSTVSVSVQQLGQIEQPKTTINGKAVSPEIKQREEKITSAGLRRWYVATLNGSDDVNPFIDYLRQQPGVEQAAIDVPSTMYATRIIPTDEPGEGGALFPNDPYYYSSGAWGQAYQDQWWLHRINPDPVWSTPPTTSSAVVAVIDTGIGTHSELNGRLWTNSNEIPNNGIDDDVNGVVDDVHGWNTYDWSNDVTDGNGHGTHVAGIIGASSNNGSGIASVAWEPKIMPIKALSNEGNGYEDTLGTAIVYAIIEGASVINMSWGSDTANQPYLQDCLNLAHDFGIVLVAAAGNSGDNVQSAYPAAYPWVISVGAWSPENTRAPFSNHGQGLDLVAPGVHILSLRSPSTDMYGDGTHIVNETYYISNGTSMAAPIVTGQVALLQSTLPKPTPAVIEAALKRGAEDVGSPGWDSDSGFGLARPMNALQEAQDMIAHPRPELEIATLSGQMSVQRQRIIRFTVLNNGNADAPSTAYSVYDADTNEQIGSGITEPIPVSSTVDTKISLTTDALSVRVALDPLHAVPEVLLGNNSAVGTIDVLYSGYPQTKDGLHAVDADFVDIEANGSKEIVSSWAGVDRTGEIDIRDVYGKSLPGWPQPVSGEMVRVVTEDIDLDGQLDIIAFSNRAADGTTPAKLYRWNAAGQIRNGWPKTVSAVDTCIGDISLGNIIGDSQLEIVITAGRQDSGEQWLLAWDGSGQIIPGWPKSQVRSYNTATPTLADIDNDGLADIMTTSYGPDYTRQTTVAFLHGNATPVTTWGTHVVDGSPTSPVITDLNSDGSSEIIIATFANISFANGDSFQTEKLYAWHTNGQNVEGWPIDVPHKPGEFSALSQPIAGDLDGDGVNEIVTSSIDGQAFAYRGNGTPVDGWPFTDIVGWFEWLNSAGALADVTGDDRPEYIVGGIFSRIYIIGQNGQRLPNWPSPARSSWANPMVRVGDADGDRSLELLFVGVDGELYLMASTDTQVNPQRGWPMNGHDAERSSTYSNPAATAPTSIEDSMPISEGDGLIIPNR